jgi:glycosyltransferase involved in cell wall biosynthesis
MPSTKNTENRMIYGSPELSESFQICALLRTFNGERYVVDSLEDLVTQEDQDFFTLVVDNCSNDETWNLVREWVDAEPLRRAASRNSFNVGGQGSIFSNLDLIKSEWVVDFHQDDRYESKHILEIHKAIASLSDDSEVVAMSTEMGSISDSGKMLGSPPRASWFFPKEASRLWFAVSTFRMQIFPLPAAAYRLESLIRAEPPWLNSTFGDSASSIFLRSIGQLHWIPKQTMRFRENSESESHAIQEPDRLKGLELGFDRILSSSWFVQDAVNLPHEDFHVLFEYLVESVRLRIGNTETSNHLLASFFDQVSLLRGYDCGLCIDFIGSRYAPTDLTARIIETVLLGSECHPRYDGATRKLDASGPKKDSNAKLSRAEASKMYSHLSGNLPHSFLKMSWKSMPTEIRHKALGSLWNFYGSGDKILTD